MLGLHLGKWIPIKKVRNLWEKIKVSPDKLNGAKILDKLGFTPESIGLYNPKSPKPPLVVSFKSHATPLPNVPQRVIETPRQLHATSQEIVVAPRETDVALRESRVISREMDVSLQESRVISREADVISQELEVKPKGPTIKEKNDSQWPPVIDKYPLQWLALCGLWLVYLIYVNFAASENTLEDMSDEIRWGGESDQLLALKRLNFYMKMEEFGVKISYKFLKTGILDEVIAAIATPRSEAVKNEAAKLLSKITASNSEARSQLLNDGGLDVLRNYADPYNLYVIYTLSNLTLQKSGCEKILKDENLLNNLTYTMAYSMKAQRAEDRFIQRALMRLFENIFENVEQASTPNTFKKQLTNLLTKSSQNLNLDPYVMVHLIHILGKLSVDAPNLRNIVPFLPPIPEDISISASQAEKSLTLLLGSICVLPTSVIFAYIYQRFFHLKSHYPITLYQKKWVKSQMTRGTIFSVFFFLCRYLTDEMSSIFSDYVAFHPDDNRTPETSYLGRFSWTNENTKAATVAMSLHLLILPIYYIGMRFSYYSLIPSLIPWKFHTMTPPEYFLGFLSYWRYYRDFIFHTPSVSEPNVDELNQMLDGTDPMSLMMEQFMAMSNGQFA